MGTYRSTRYTYTAIILHWIVAIFMIANVGLILSVDLWPEDFIRPVIDTHKSIGITVLGLGLMRLLWRASHRPPALPESFPEWERKSAHWAHWGLYALILMLPISGWMHDSAWKDAAKFPMTLYGAIPWPRIGLIMDVEPAAKERLHDLFGLIHTSFGYALYVLVALHIAGALKHQFVDRHAELQRMLPGRRS
jgi:cytochrome b561